MKNMAEIEISQLFLLPFPCSLSSTGERIICIMMKDFQNIMRLEKLIQLWGSQMCAFPGGALSESACPLSTLHPVAGGAQWGLGGDQLDFRSSGFSFFFSFLFSLNYIVLKLYLTLAFTGPSWTLSRDW